MAEPVFNFVRALKEIADDPAKPTFDDGLELAARYCGWCAGDADAWGAAAMTGMAANFRRMKDNLRKIRHGRRY